MSLSKKRTQRQATILGALIGFIIIFTFVISLIAPDLGTRTSDDILLPTLTPFGTPPPPTKVIIPTPELNPQLAGRPAYVHSTGLFQTFYPAGADWLTSEGQGDNNTISAVIQSPERLAVIHNYVRPGVQYETLDALSTDFLIEAHFVDAWTEYDSWQETGRVVGENNVTVDFTLISNDVSYLGRSVAWVDNGWLYVSRLVSPANNPELLDLLQSLVIPAFKGYPQLQTLPVTWPAYIDQGLGFLLKHPSNWQIIAGGTGRPVTFSVLSDEDKLTVRVWTAADKAADSEEQAEAFLAETESTAEVTEIAPVEHEMGTGYQIAYTYRDTAGDPHSGLMVMLNDTRGTLLVANLQATPPETNWLDTENLSGQDSETVQALLNGFAVLPDDARFPETTLEEAEPAESSPTPSE